MNKSRADIVRVVAEGAMDTLKRISSVVSMQEADDLVKQAVVSLVQGFGTGPAQSLGVVPVNAIKTSSWRLGTSSDIFRRAGFLKLCLDMDLPITLVDIAFIRRDITLRRVEGSHHCYVVIDSEAARSLVSRLGIYAIVSRDEWGNPEADKKSAFFLRRHGRMSAEINGGLSKNKEALVSKAKAATLKYYADMARKAQKNYMIKFNALTP